MTGWIRVTDQNFRRKIPIHGIMDSDMMIRIIFWRKLENPIHRVAWAEKFMISESLKQNFLIHVHVSIVATLIHRSTVAAYFSIIDRLEVECGQVHKSISEFLLPKKIIIGVEIGGKLCLEVFKDGCVWCQYSSACYPISVVVVVHDKGGNWV